MGVLRRLGVGLAALALGSGALTVGVGPAYAADEDLAGCEETTPEVDSYSTDLASEPLERLGIDEAHRVFGELTGGKEPGAGVRVAVADTGVRPGTPGLPVSATAQPGFSPIQPHGTVVAGLIAGDARAPRDGGLVGVAPGATIVDVPFYGNSDQEGGDPPRGESARWAIDWLLKNQSKYDIVNFSFWIGPDPVVQRGIKQLWRAGKILVAAAGNRPAEGQPGYDEYGTYNGSEDVSEAWFPAGYDETVAVSADVDEARDGISLSQVNVANRQTDVSAPSGEAISYGLGTASGTCRVAGAATSYSAAIVSGIFAMLKSAYPRESNAELRDRLEQTASGRSDQVGRLGNFRGHGVVQPVAALTRDLPEAELAEVEKAVKAAPPQREADVLARTRSQAVWWGLLGGGALVLALVLRPLLVRRRR